MQKCKLFAEAVIHFFERRPMLTEEEESLLDNAYKMLEELKKIKEA